MKKLNQAQVLLDSLKEDFEEFLDGDFRNDWENAVIGLRVSATHNGNTSILVVDFDGKNEKAVLDSRPGTWPTEWHIRYNETYYDENNLASTDTLNHLKKLFSEALTIVKTTEEINYPPLETRINSFSGNGKSVALYFDRLDNRYHCKLVDYARLYQWPENSQRFESFTEANECFNEFVKECR